VVELSLPKITSVGHVDLRFTIQGKARSIPDIRVALLCHKVDARYRGKVTPHIISCIRKCLPLFHASRPVLVC